MKIKLKKNHYLIIQKGTTFNRTAEVFKEGDRFPRHSKDFSDSTPLNEIVEWGNNNVHNVKTNPKQ